MLLRALVLAFLASLSPTALLVTAVYLGSDRPTLIATFYLAGAITMSVVTAIAIILVLRNIGLHRPEHRTARYVLRLAVGVALLIVALVVARRRPPVDPHNKSGPIARLVDKPAPISAFAVGMLLFAPGATFFAAVHVIATASAAFDLTAFTLIVVVMLNVMLVWLPIVLSFAAPQMTTRYLGEFNEWLHRHGSRLAVAALCVAGTFLLFDGLRGLATAR